MLGKVFTGILAWGNWMFHGGMGLWLHFNGNTEGAYFTLALGVLTGVSIIAMNSGREN